MTNYLPQWHRGLAASEKLSNERDKLVDDVVTS